MYWLRRLFRKAQTEHQLDSELRFHLEQRAAEFAASGLAPEEARRRARIEFGGVEGVKEECRESRRIHLVETFLQDLHYGLRVLRRSPGFTTVALLTLALGIGANTAIFSVVNGVLLNRLPFRDPERLVILHESKVNFDEGSISYPNFLDWQKENTVFSAIGAYRFNSMALSGKGEAELLRGQMVSADFFPVLGVTLVAGRNFTADDDRLGAAPVVLISERLWKNRFNASPFIAGTQVTLDATGYTIVGVIPDSFHLAIVNFHDGDIYTPIGQWNVPGFRERKNAFGLRAFARLKPGISLEQAHAEMDRISANLARAYPESDTGIGAKVVPLKQQMIGSIQPVLLILLAAVGLVLLIACVNVANLLLARSAVRAREFTIRTALGAGRGRVIRQLLTESVLLSLGGGLLGLSVAGLVTRLAVRVQNLPRAQEIRTDAHVLLFSLAVSLLVGVLFGLAPALRLSRTGAHNQLKEGGRGTIAARHRTQSVFVAIEMTLALVLLISAGLLLRSLTRLWNVDPGFDSRNVAGFDLTPPPSLQSQQPEAIRAALREMEDRLARIPGVEAVAMGWQSFPLSGDSEQQFWLDGQPRPANQNDMNWALWYEITPGYFKTMGIKLKRGRLLGPEDNHQSQLVTVIDESFALRFFPNQDPLGHRIHVENTERIAEIVGVVGHVKQWGLDSDEKQSLQAQMYTLAVQSADRTFPRLAGGMGVVLRSQLPPSSLFNAARRSLAEINSQYVVSGEETIEQLLAESLATRRFSMLLFGVFAALALVLAGIGIYGVVSYVVSQRTQEIGIRMALGASRGNVLGMVLGQGARMALLGVLGGLIASLALTRLLAGQLYGVTPRDPVTFVAVSLLLTGIALLACYLPARRAARVDPMHALRCE
ncbi:MAG TPA: ABC transporter permease [Candidatus Angelobacter sp.]